MPKSFHIRFVLEDIVKNALSNRVGVVLVDLIMHGVDQVLDSFLFQRHEGHLGSV